MAELETSEIRKLLSLHYFWARYCPGFKNYLANRSQLCLMDSHLLSVQFRPVVPSILGPLLFSVYMNPLTNIRLSQISVLILYADDIVLYRLVNGPADIIALQSNVDAISTWVIQVGLSLNCKKNYIKMVFEKQLWKYFQIYF